MHEGHFLSKIDPQLISRQGDWCPSDVYVHGDLLDFVIFDVDDQVVPEAAACIVEHGDEDALGLLLVESAQGWLAEHADAFVISEMDFLGTVQCLVSYKCSAHLGCEGLLFSPHESLV